MKTNMLSKLFIAAGFVSIAGLAQAESPVGTWTLGYDWSCDGSYSQTTLTVNADGTFANGSYTGTWWEDHSTFTFTFSSGTTYTGYHVNKSMTGVQRSYSGLSGCWYAHPNDGYNYDTLDSGADVGADELGPEG
jgi:hypothetical protein